MYEYLFQEKKCIALAKSLAKFAAGNVYFINDWFTSKLHITTKSDITDIKYL